MRAPTSPPAMRGSAGFGPNISPYLRLAHGVRQSQHLRQMTRASRRAASPRSERRRRAPEALSWSEPAAAHDEEHGKWARVRLCRELACSQLGTRRGFGNLLDRQVVADQ